MRLLILENDAFVAHLLSTVVEACGHSIDAVAGTVEDAVASALRLGPDLVVADINLGTTSDGIDAAVQIRKATGIRTIFVTACADPETRQRAQHAWPAAFVTKPFDVQVFSQVLSGVASVVGAGSRQRAIMLA